MTAFAAGPQRPRVLYVQYANPAAYPPSRHAIGLLAGAGADVRVLGLDTLNDQLGTTYPAGVESLLFPSERPGWRQKLHYAKFTREALRLAATFRPDWVYVVDALATPVARVLMVRGTSRLVYQEHDVPTEAWQSGPASWFMRRVLASRTVVARQAAIRMAPNAARADVLRRHTGCGPVTVVRNYPRRDEARVEPVRPGGEGLRLLYQGSVVPARLPLSVIDALTLLPDSVTLVVAGYETMGHQGYVQALLARARDLGIGSRVTYAGVLSRPALLALTDSCDAGLLLFADMPADPNEASMVGASNKIFEYLARGLPIVVGLGAEWRVFNESARVAVMCDRERPRSIAAAIETLRADSLARHAMGERGRQRVLSEWNYERSFEPVLRAVMSGYGSSRIAVQAAS